MRTIAKLAAACIPVLGAACGGVSSGSAPPAQATPDEALYEAERALDTALADVASPADGSGSFAQAPSEPSPQPGADAQPASPAAPPRVSAHREGEAEASASKQAGDPCERACEAGSAIARAVERICELDGPEGVRCERARGRLEAARARLAGTCPSCVL